MALIALAVQTQELQDLIDLGKDAADILWEMAALHEETPGTKDVIDNVKLLQVCPGPKIPPPPMASTCTRPVS